MIIGRGLVFFSLTSPNPFDITQGHKIGLLCVTINRTNKLMEK